MIQVLGLRDYVDPRTKKTNKRETFFLKGWRFESVADVFNQEKRTALLANIPTEEHFNLYFTVADCFEEPGRILKEQWAIPFDIDDLDLSVEGEEYARAEEAVRAASEVLGVDFLDMGVCFSGNGVQFFVLLDSPILSADFFEETRPHYNLVCKKIQNALLSKNIKGTVDTSVWSKARLMRLPDTENRKPGRPTRMAKVLHDGLKPLYFDIAKLSGLTEVEIGGHVPDQVLKNYPKPDTKSICEGCKFLQHCKSNPAKISEPEWYAMVSITARLEDGKNLTHEYSEGHPQYNHYETENKIDQALAAAGPRTCKSIEGLWDGCQNCDYYGKLTSPIMIRGADYIMSSDFGFRERKMDKEGNVRPGKPMYMDLVKTFQLEQPFKVIADNELVYTFDGKKWIYCPSRTIKAWAMEKIRPEPSVTEMNEFFGVLLSFNVVRQDWFTQTSADMTPFKNGVLNRITGELSTHGPQYGFFHTLDFDYDPRATIAPRWEQFIHEIAGSADIAELLEEYGGYCLSGDSCWPQKALFLVGDGANGKSVYMEILGELAGKDAHAAVPLQDLEKETSRYRLVNKLFNYSEETSVRALQDSSIFKTLVNGGAMQVKQLYVQPYEVDNRAKLIMSANDMPRNQDMSHGFFRRLLLVELKRQFNPGDEGYDPFIKDKLRAELPGICNRLMKAYARVKETQRFSAEAAIRTNVQKLKIMSDTVQMFYEEHLETVEDATVYAKSVEIYEHYRQMCDVKGFKALNHVHFFRQLYRIDRSLEGRKQRVGSRETRSYAYVGIKLHKEF